MMKRALTIMLICCAMSYLCGCGKLDPAIQTNTKQVTIPDRYGTYEWVDENGVHYWIIYGRYKFGLAPRYNKDGSIMIDKK